ncbi:MAG: hypothetical protein K5870_11925 [Lachnospiraceae bacterium]|nr:hypothetical protein [Lachnospiraceae bacterium]
MERNIMKKSLYKTLRTITAGIVLVGSIMMLSGCTGTPKTSAKDEVPKAPYFSKGVYANFAKEAEDPDKTYFYVFSDDSYGYTADGANEGIGLPFDIEQTDGSVKFVFGGADEDEEKLIITSADDGTVCGYFEGAEDRELVFEPVKGVDPESFSAENFVNGPKDCVYRDANGWSIRYDATKFEVTTKAPDVFIVYTGESAGTNMITVTYTVDNKAEAAIRELGESLGDKVQYQESIFPGTENVKSYYAIVFPEEGGSGAGITAFARDYMDGALIVRIDSHNGQDEEMNMSVSDSIANVVDSFQFD